MKKLSFLLCFNLLASMSLVAAGPTTPPKVAIVNFKQVVEESKLGKQEQASFENLKKQMEAVIGEKEKSLNEVASKLNDADYLDSLTPEAETELKRKFRAMNQELSQQQAQYYQALQQSNMKIVQKLQEAITKACEQVAKDDKVDLILNDEACFFTHPDLNVSSKVVKILDQMNEQEIKDALPAVKK